MKKIIALILLSALLLGGCGSSSSEETVKFYYLRGNMEYGAPDGAISYEERDVSGHKNNPKYLLSLYFQGPLDPNLVSPYPTSFRTLKVQVSDDQIHVALDPSFNTLKDLDLTIACVCLARTCMSIADTDTVIIESIASDGTVLLNKTITADDLLTEESLIPEQTQ